MVPLSLPRRKDENRETMACLDRWPWEKEPACFWCIQSPRDRQSELVVQTWKGWPSRDSWWITLVPNSSTAWCSFEQAIFLFKDGVRKMQCSGWRMEYTSLLQQDDRRSPCKNWSALGFPKRGMPLHLEWSLPLITNNWNETDYIITMHLKTLKNLMNPSSGSQILKVLSFERRQTWNACASSMSTNIYRFQNFEFTIALKLQTIVVVISFISGKKNRKLENYGVITECIVVW